MHLLLGNSIGGSSLARWFLSLADGDLGVKDANATTRLIPTLQQAIFCYCPISSSVLIRAFLPFRLSCMAHSPNHL
jgi:hypothetical protein